MQHTSKPAPDVPKWSALLVEAVNKPGLIMEAYSALGYTNVQDYAGGKQDWLDAGLPTESDHQH